MAAIGSGAARDEDDAGYDGVMVDQQTDIDLPPVAIPSVDLGIISPSFAGRDARFNGQLHFDNKANRIVLEGDLTAH